ncbi:hypothetical protein HBH98_131230 [Parastagonospora nodorum]|nr:hypothetical protein HBH53_038140 [Parastagonospora nodorum]KAH3976510.1 hypothetical protein HBH52_120500 [Parastagonospora nodorum]KAH3984699.1 hypothetical protein HBH51_028280 [Parastagonospora nodorum]KAH4000477.1 hypothetical protein HBI10_101060 [Parastagonospora nodorum]KAH4026615.1 hypothetical protein HBI13_064540 [Parastagonospora nodorum]
MLKTATSGHQSLSIPEKMSEGKTTVCDKSGIEFGKYPGKDARAQHSLGEANIGTRRRAKLEVTC